MYKLTSQMLRDLERSLREYHKLFDGGRCSGWELEELIVDAIKSDPNSGHRPDWRGSGHDDKEDIKISVNGHTYLLQIKSGETTKQHLVLSGHRLGRFDDDLALITDYLNNRNMQMLAVPYKRVDKAGRVHVYQVSYVDAAILSGLNAKAWVPHGKQFKQTNAAGVEFSLRPSMSWQIWWRIPISRLEQEAPFTIIGRKLSR